MRLGLVHDQKGRPVKLPVDRGVWRFDEDDFLVYALICDPVYCAEMLGTDPSNFEYGGMFIVRDYQYPLFRTTSNYAGFTCARSVGKTESIKWRGMTHIFKRVGENLLLTAPELIHLLPLTDAVEDKIRTCRLTREFLDTRGGKTGFTHRPFGADFLDGTKLVGRIPRLTGTGVKGQHQPDLIIDEGQDYPEKGWTEVHETVLKDHIDRDGNPDFTYHFYGVHSGARDTGFAKRAAGAQKADDVAFEVVQITALQRPGWNATEKAAARAAYGGTAAPDYRRNILGEPGGAASPFFVSSRLAACVDNNRDSDYNVREIVPGQHRDPDNEKKHLIRAEEFDELMLPIADVLDLPTGYKSVWGGMDIGLTQSPTVITLWSHERVGKVPRLKLIRHIQFERMRTRTIREALYAIAHAYGHNLHGFGTDITGLGFPMFQEMEDDEACPQHLKDVHTGYFFNAKLEVGVDKDQVTKDEQGRMRDALGNQVYEKRNELTGETYYVTTMPMVEAGTRYLREMVDRQLLMLPFDPEITGDMQGETQQRVKRIAGLKNKPNAMHILDSMRAMAVKYREADVMAALAPDRQVPVLEVTF